MAQGFANDPKRAREAGKKSKPGKHTKTVQWEQLGEFITQEGAQRAAKILNGLDEVEFLEQYGKLLSYFKPKLSSATLEADNNINITLIHPDKDLMEKI